MAQGRTAQGPRGTGPAQEAGARGDGQVDGECAATAPPPPPPKARRAAAECHGKLAPDPGPNHGEREVAARQPLPIPLGHTIPYPPPLQTKVTIVGEKTKILREILSGNFWYTNLWVPDPLPPPFPPSNISLVWGGGADHPWFAAREEEGSVQNKMSGWQSPMRFVCTSQCQEFGMPRPPVV